MNKFIKIPKTKIFERLIIIILLISLGFLLIRENYASRIINRFEGGEFVYTYDKNPNFLQIDKYNFDLDTASAAKDKGILLSPPILDDYYNRPRKGNPDLGAFESKF